MTWKCCIDSNQQNLLVLCVYYFSRFRRELDCHMSSGGRLQWPSPPKGRKRIAPWAPAGNVVTEVAKHDGYSARRSYGLKSALDYPDLPLFRSLGPGTQEFNSTCKFEPLVHPHREAVAQLTMTQRELVSAFQVAQIDFGGPLRSPRMSMPAEPSPVQTARQPRGRFYDEVVFEKPKTPRAEMDPQIALPALFTGQRTPAQNRHLVAVNQQGDRLRSGAKWKAVPRMKSGVFENLGASTGGATGTSSVPASPNYTEGGDYPETPGSAMVGEEIQTGQKGLPSSRRGTNAPNQSTTGSARVTQTISDLHRFHDVHHSGHPTPQTSSIVL
jgi:hypothetical protein